MKMYQIILFLGFIAYGFQIESCPTCSGRITQDSAPFFTDDFYQPTHESMDYIYQQLLQEEAEQAEKTA